MGVTSNIPTDDSAVFIVTKDSALTDLFYTAFSMLKKDNCRIETANDYEESLTEIENNIYDMIFFDLDILDSGGLIGVKDIVSRRPSAYLIAIISDESEEIRDQLIFSGAAECILKKNLGVDSISQILIGAPEKKIQAKAELSSYDLFKKLAEIVPDPVVIADLEGKMVYISERAVQDFGAPSSDEMIGINIFGLVVPRQRKIAMENFRQLLSEGYSLNKEYEIVRKDLSTMNIQLNAAILKDEECQAKAALFTVRDITSKQSLEKELISSSMNLKQEVDERSAELERTNEKLRKSIDRYRQAEYLTSITYDLALALCLATSLEDALRLAVDAAILVSKMDCGGIYLWDEDKQILDLAFQRGNSPEFIKETRRYTMESEQVQLMLTGKPVYSLLNEIGLKLTPVCLREGLKAVAFIPLIHNGKIIGTMNVGSRTADDVPFIIRQCLETIAVQISGIIQRFKAERVVSRSEIRLRAQFDNIPVPTFVWEEENGEIILKDYNEAAKRFNLQGGEHLDIGLKASVFIENYEEEYKKVLRCFNEKTTIETEMKYTFKSTGLQKILQVKMAYVPDKQILMHVIDITDKKYNEEMMKDYSEKLEEKVRQRTAELEKAYNDLSAQMEQRKRMERELSESRERYCSLIEASGDIIGEIDMDGIVTYVSPDINDVLGFSSEDIIGKMKLGDFITENGSEKVERLLRLYKEKPFIIQSVEIPLKKKSGGSLIFEVSATPIFGENGELIGARGIGRDITGRKDAIENLEGIQHSLEKKASDLEDINEEFSHYAYVVSHDLKEPLRTIYNSADSLKKDLEPVLSRNQEKYFEYLMDAVKLSVDYVEGLLTLSRIGRKQRAPEQIDMNIFFKGILNTLNLPENVVIKIPSDLPSIESDPILLQQIFQNLVSNAVKFNDSSGKVLELGWMNENNNNIKFFLKDNGRGIDPANFDKIFQVFEKIHIKDDDEGMGLGLAIVKKAVHRLNGSVHVDSKPGEGSTFFVVLPRKQPEFVKEKA